MVFELLHPEVREALRRMGYSRPTDIQSRAIPIILDGKNVLISSPTGTGKTEAAVLPVASKMLEERGVGIHALYITPMRALNRDLLNRLEKFFGLLGLRVGVRHGDTPQRERRRQREEPPHMLITTPESLQFLLINKSMRKWLRSVKWVIIDEVHELVNDKRGIQLSLSLERLVNLAGDFQRIALSASIGNLDLVAKYVGGARPVQVISSLAIKEMRLSVRRPQEHPDPPGDMTPESYGRLHALSELIKEGGGVVLLFSNTRDTAELLGNRLKGIFGLNVEVYHGSLSKERREGVEELMRGGKVDAVVTTSSLELGIDVGRISKVIQYMSPRQVTRLIQRVGRSGHGVGLISRGVIVASDFDDYLESVVIAVSAKKGLLEKDVEYHEKAMDVLAHQTLGMLMDAKADGRSATIEYIYETASRAHPYASLGIDEVKRLVDFLVERRLIGIDGDVIYPRRGSIRYYVEGASMIPDEQHYLAVDYVTNKAVGELDEEFVSTIEPGTKIILSAKLWNVLSINQEEKRVYMEPAASLNGALPAWIGEEIPVLRQVASEVCELRAELMRKGIKAIHEYAGSDVSLNEEDLDALSRELEDVDLDIPTPHNIVVEAGKRAIVIHSCGGSKGNEALGLYLSRYLFQRFMVSVGYRADPYRILLMPARPIPAEAIRDALMASDEDVKQRLWDGVKASKLFRYRFIHVARRMGVLPRGPIDVNISRLVEAYRGSILEEEVIKEIMVDKLDVSAVMDLVRGVRDGGINVSIKQVTEFSSLALPIIEIEGLDFTVDEVPKSALMDVIKRRIMENEVTLICMKCGWNFTAKVKYMKEDTLRCPHCGLRTISMLKYRDEKVDYAIKVINKFRNKRPLSPQERQFLEVLRQRSLVILQFGLHGLIALAAHGVGSSSAIRKVLTKTHSEEDLYASIMEAEREYIRTRLFWDD
ncbi:ATP-dependent helicase [Thermocladium modestius]|uniref:ATP-dependent helicase n=1 Tax=Thermocladium modestius TaxID=62609 RepID=A0A830GVM3_9CREN|nr:ATP-dependent helicase [Thermocladium modestius]